VFEKIEAGFMDCNETAQKLSAFLDGELPEEERLQVSQHLETCRSCALECRSLASAWARIVELPRVESRTHLWPGIEARLPRTRRLVAQPWRWARARPFPTLATAALIVGLLPGLRVGEFVARPIPQTHVVDAADVDTLHVEYFGDVFPGSVAEAVVSVSVNTRTSPAGRLAR
jgi:anti-sigma factor RsiW